MEKGLKMSMWRSLLQRGQGVVKTPVMENFDQVFAQNLLDDGPLPSWGEDRPLEASRVQIDDFFPIGNGVGAVALSTRRILNGKEHQLYSAWKELRKLANQENARLKEHLAVTDFVGKGLRENSFPPEELEFYKQLEAQNRKSMYKTRANMETAWKAKDWFKRDLDAVRKRLKLLKGE